MTNKTRTSEEIVNSMMALAMKNKYKLNICVTYFSEQNMVDVRVRPLGDINYDETLLFEYHELTERAEIELLERKLIDIIQSYDLSPDIQHVHNTSDLPIRHVRAPLQIMQDISALALKTEVSLNSGQILKVSFVYSSINRLMSVDAYRYKARAGKKDVVLIFKARFLFDCEQPINIERIEAELMNLILDEH